MKKTVTIIFSFLLSLVIPPQSYAEDGNWHLYVNGNEINDIAVYANHIWCATEGSVVCWNIWEGSYNNYTMIDGLLSNYIKLISTDNTGLPWVTYGDNDNKYNLSHFDGTSWEHFNKDNSGLPEFIVKTVFCNRYGDLWLGIPRVGLVRYDGTSWDTFSSEHTFDDTPKQIIIDNEGVKWIAASGGLWSIDNGTWNHYDTNNGLIDDNVNCIAIDDNDRIWVGTNKGVSHFDGTVWIDYTKNHGLVNNRVKTIAFDRHGEVWIGTKSGVSRYDGSTWESYTTDNGLIANTVTDIEVDRDNNIWFCHKGVDKGVTVFDGLEMKWYTIWNTDIPSNTVNAIASDDDGVLWFALENGLCSYNGDSWKIYTDSDGLADNRIRDIVIGVNNTKWIIYEKSAHAGVTCFDGSKWITYTEEDGLGDSYVTAVAQEDENVIWFGLSYGVTVYDGNAWDSFPKNDRLISTTIYGITQDNDGVIWCATDEGLSRFDGASWWTYTEKHGLPANKLKDVKTGIDGTLWCLTSDGYLVSFDGTDFQSHPVTGEGIPEGASPTIHHITLDKSGIVWTDCATRGFNENETPEMKFWRFDGAQWISSAFPSPDDTPYTHLPQNVTSIGVDDDNFIWFGTDRSGLKCFDGSSWKTYAVDGPLGNSFLQMVVDYDNRKIFSDFEGIAIYDDFKWVVYPRRSLWPSIAVGLDNTIWLAGRVTITSIDGTDWQRFTSFDIFGSMIFFNSIAVDNNDIKWIGTGGKGIVSYDGISWKQYTTDDDLANKFIGDIIIDQNNVKWILVNSSGAGVSSFDDVSWKTYAEADGLVSNDIRLLIVDNNNIKWFASHENGISRYDGTWKTFTEADGLISNIVQTMAVDTNNVMWFGSEKGVSSFDGISWTNYTENDGLIDNRVKHITVDHNNVKWMCTSSGITSFNDTIWLEYNEVSELSDRYFLSIVVDKNNIKWFLSSTGIVSYDDRPSAGSDKTPRPIIIRGNYPNPFNTQTTVEFYLSSWGQVKFTVNNIMGQTLREFDMGKLQAGNHKINWDGLDRNGNPVSSGVYIYRITAGSHHATGRMLFLK